MKNSTAGNFKKLNEYYKEAGYITGFAGDLCYYSETLETEGKKKIKFKTKIYFFY